MLEFLFITFALGVVALLTAFFRVYGKAPSSPRKLLQTAEIHMRVALMKRFNTLGTAEFLPVASRPQAKG